MPRKNKNYPRLLTHVLRAVAELRENNGSTIKKIMNQVQSAINISNVKPKPRNVVMQVRRAIKHGIENGVLKQRGGKIQLTLTTENVGEIKNAKGVRTQCAQNVNRRSKRILNKKKEKKQPILVDSCSTLDSDYGFNNKNYKVRQARAKKRKSVKGKRKRKPTPGNVNPPEDNPEPQENFRPRSLTRNSQPALNVEEYDQQGQICHPYDGEGQYNQCVNQSDCGNPDCLCNLKQEPDDQQDLYDGDSYM